MRPREYYQTTPLTPAQLAAELANAAHQDDQIFAVFRCATGPLTPSQVHKVCEGFGRQWPLTSVRRAISTLTKAELLEKTKELRDGEYGKPEHVWKLITPPQPVQGELVW